MLHKKGNPKWNARKKFQRTSCLAETLPGPSCALRNSLLWWTSMYIIPHKMGTVLHSFLHYGGVGRQICSHDKRDPYLDFCNWIWREENQGVHIPLSISMFWSDTSNCTPMILLGPSHTSATSKFPNQLFTRYCCSTNPCTERVPQTPVVSRS
jgi:hypothetical protein